MMRRTAKFSTHLAAIAFAAGAQAATATGGADVDLEDDATVGLTGHGPLSSSLKASHVDDVRQAVASYEQEFVDAIRETLRQAMLFAMATGEFLETAATQNEHARTAADGAVEVAQRAAAALSWLTEGKGDDSATARPLPVSIMLRPNVN